MIPSNWEHLWPNAARDTFLWCQRSLIHKKIYNGFLFYQLAICMLNVINKKEGVIYFNELLTLCCCLLKNTSLARLFFCSLIRELLHACFPFLCPWGRNRPTIKILFCYSWEFAWWPFESYTLKLNAEVVDCFWLLTLHFRRRCSH